MMSTSICMTSQTAWLARIRLANAFGPASPALPVPRPFIILELWCDGSMLVRWSHPHQVSGARDLCLLGLACHNVHFDVRGTHLMVSRWTEGRRRGTCTALQGCMSSLPGSWARLSGQEEIGAFLEPPACTQHRRCNLHEVSSWRRRVCLPFPALRQSLSMLDVGHSFDWFLCELVRANCCFRLGEHRVTRVCDWRLSSSTFVPNSYDIAFHNCNSFSAAMLEFLQLVGFQLKFEAPGIGCSPIHTRTQPISEILLAISGAAIWEAFRPSAPD